LQKIPDHIAALEGHRISDHHRQMIHYSREHLRFLEEHIQELDKRIVGKIEALGCLAQRQLLQTVPAVNENTAASVSVLAEVGLDMDQFESEKNLSSWAGMCPGNKRSVGKKKGSKTTKGNRLVARHADRIRLGGIASG
jgi:transposase